MTTSSRRRRSGSLAEAERRILLLTRAHRDRGGRSELVYWGVDEKGPVRLVFTKNRPVFFVTRDTPTETGERRAVELSTLVGDHPVDAVYCSTRRQLLDERERLRSLGTWPLEADVRPEDRFLMERFVREGVRVRGASRRRGAYDEMVDPEIEASEVDHCPTLFSFDVESDGLDGVLFSIACAGVGGDRVWAVSDGPAPDGVECVPTERMALEAFLEHVAQVDPDVLIGWNVVGFDLRYLERRCAANGLRLTLGRGGRVARIRQPSGRFRTAIARIPGSPRHGRHRHSPGGDLVV